MTSVTSVLCVVCVRVCVCVERGEVAKNYFENIAIAFQHVLLQ